jgi:hypothetical protein
MEDVTARPFTPGSCFFLSIYLPIFSFHFVSFRRSHHNYHLSRKLNFKPDVTDIRSNAAPEGASAPGTFGAFAFA